MDPDVLEDFEGGAAAAEERETVLWRAGAAAAFVDPAMLGLEDRGGFFTDSDIEARGRGAVVVEGALAELTEPVGDATALRAGTFSVDGFEFAEVDKDGLVSEGAAVFVGTTDALRLAVVGVAAGLDDIEDDGVGFDVAVGADVVGFLRAGAVALVAVGGAGTAFAPEGFTEPAPKVPELMIFFTVGVGGPPFVFALGGADIVSFFLAVPGSLLSVFLVVACSTGVSTCSGWMEAPFKSSSRKSSFDAAGSVPWSPLSSCLTSEVVS